MVGGDVGNVLGIEVTGGRVEKAVGAKVVGEFVGGCVLLVPRERVGDLVGPIVVGATVTEEASTLSSGPSANWFAPLAHPNLNDCLLPLQLGRSKGHANDFQTRFPSRLTSQLLKLVRDRGGRRKSEAARA